MRVQSATHNLSLTSGSFLLFFGKLADMFGRRSMFLASLFLFAAFALGTGFSQDAMTLIILNGVMGLMCALAVPPCQGILGSIYEKPSRRKNLAFASFSAGNPLGFVFGTIFSGIATQLFGWRAPFWLLAIIYLIVAVIAGFTVPLDDSDKLPLTVHSFKQFDVIGATLIIGGIGLFSTALSAGPDAAQGFKSTYILAFLILGVVLIVAFILWETRFPFPLMPMNVWRDREFCLMYVLSSLPKAQQSIAASIFQTITKLAVTVGFGVETAVFNSVVADPASTGYYDNDPYEPFAAVFWAAAVTTFLSLFAVPFLRIKTQGNHN
ncbi:aminotriazole resistance [Alternaria alternata]|nr:aminotriazole resistance [Alternaria alternata]